MYIVRENDKLKKYSVSIDIEKVKELKDKILDEFKIIYHVNDECWCYCNSSAMKKFDSDIKHIFWSRVKNYEPKECIYQGKYDWCDDKYHLEYDFYEIPKVIELLNKVIGSIEYEFYGYRYYGNVKSKLESYKGKYKYDVNLDEVIFTLLNFNDLTYTNDLSMVTDSKKVVKTYEPDKKKEKLLQEYINEIKKLITVTLVDEFSYKSYNETIKFLDLDVEMVKENSVLKYIK